MATAVPADELEQLLHRQRPTAQARVLTMLGIPFLRHPLDGTIIVARAALERALAHNQAPAAADNVIPMVNVEAIRAHGKTAKTRRR